MKLTFYPSTKTGIFSITFMIMAVMTLTAFVFSIIALVSGVLAVLRDKERSVLCLGAIVVSFIAVYFGLSELIGEMSFFDLQTK